MGILSRNTSSDKPQGAKTILRLLGVKSPENPPRSERDIRLITPNTLLSPVSRDPPRIPEIMVDSTSMVLLPSAHIIERDTAPAADSQNERPSLPLARTGSKAVWNNPPHEDDEPWLSKVEIRQWAQGVTTGQEETSANVQQATRGIMAKARELRPILTDQFSGVGKLSNESDHSLAKAKDDTDPAQVLKRKVSASKLASPLITNINAVTSAAGGTAQTYQCAVIRRKPAPCTDEDLIALQLEADLYTVPEPYLIPEAFRVSPKSKTRPSAGKPTLTVCTDEEAKAFVKDPSFQLSMTHEARRARYWQTVGEIPAPERKFLADLTARGVDAVYKNSMVIPRPHQKPIGPKEDVKNSSSKPKAIPKKPRREIFPPGEPLNRVVVPKGPYPIEPCVVRLVPKKTIQILEKLVSTMFVPGEISEQLDGICECKTQVWCDIDCKEKRPPRYRLFDCSNWTFLSDGFMNNLYLQLERKCVRLNMRHERHEQFGLPDAGYYPAVREYQTRRAILKETVVDVLFLAKELDVYMDHRDLLKREIETEDLRRYLKVRRAETHMSSRASTASPNIITPFNEGRAQYDDDDWFLDRYVAHTDETWKEGRSPKDVVISGREIRTNSPASTVPSDRGHASTSCPEAIIPPEVPLSPLDPDGLAQNQISPPSPIAWRKEYSSIGPRNDDIPHTNREGNPTSPSPMFPTPPEHKMHPRTIPLRDGSKISLALIEAGLTTDDLSSYQFGGSGETMTKQGAKKTRQRRTSVSHSRRSSISLRPVNIFSRSVDTLLKLVESKQDPIDRINFKHPKPLSRSRSVIHKLNFQSKGGEYKDAYRPVENIPPRSTVYDTLTPKYETPKEKKSVVSDTRYMCIDIPGVSAIPEIIDVPMSPLEWSRMEQEHADAELYNSLSKGRKMMTRLKAIKGSMKHRAVDLMDMARGKR